MMTVEQDMRMSHVYQPLVLLALIAAGGSATLRQPWRTTAASCRSGPPGLPGRDGGTTETAAQTCCGSP